MKMILIGIATFAFLKTAYSTTYAPSPTTEYFRPYERKWKSEPVKDGKPFLSVTTANYILWFRGFAIDHSESDGVIDSGWILQIVEQEREELHAIYLFGGGAWYFKGRLDHESSKIVFESLFPELKQPSFLTVDFSESPEFAPSVTVSHVKSGAN